MDTLIKKKIAQTLAVSHWAFSRRKWAESGTGPICWLLSRRHACCAAILENQDSKSGGGSAFVYQSTLDPFPPPNFQKRESPLVFKSKKGAKARDQSQDGRSREDGEQRQTSKITSRRSMCQSCHSSLLAQIVPKSPLYNFNRRPERG